MVVIRDEVRHRMELTLIQNDFCEFPWPSGISWRFQSIEHGDTKTLVLSPRGTTLYGMVQVWDLNGDDLKTFHAMQWSRLHSAPTGFPPGITVERIETDGYYATWEGVSNLINCDRFVDYELMSQRDDTIVYVRRSSNEPDTLNIQQELSMIKVGSPANWTVGASLERRAAADGG